MSTMQLRTNERGNAKLCPITDLEVRIASNNMVILVIQYVETIEQFDSGERKQLQTVLSAKRALKLAATLEKAAALFQESKSDHAVQ